MHSSHDETGRRRFFARTVALIQSVIGGSLAVVLGGAAASSAFTRRQEGWWTAARLRDLPDGEPTPVVVRVLRQDGFAQSVDRRSILLVRNGGSQVTALDSTCTHLGCIVSWDRERGQLRCPCHGGVYDRTGAVVSGPPPQALASIPTRVDGDRILVQI
jgi:Rieske Fe-S protein